MPAEYRDEELLASVVADLIGIVRHIAVGNASPIPATAALLARARGRELNLDRPYVSLLGDRKSTRLNSSHMSESRMPSSA